MAPENKFPAAHDEAIDAYKYVLKNAEGWGYNPKKIALVGEMTLVAHEDRGRP